MLRKLLPPIGIALVFASPALPDIINVTVSGLSSGSGYINITCGIATPGCIDGLFNVPYSFGPTSGSDSGGAEAPPEIFPNGGSVDRGRGSEFGSNCPDFGH
jgi:hypothetical protein